MPNENNVVLNHENHPPILHPQPPFVTPFKLGDIVTRLKETRCQEGKLLLDQKALVGLQQGLFAPFCNTALPSQNPISSALARQLLPDKQVSYVLTCLYRITKSGRAFRRRRFPGYRPA